MLPIRVFIVVVERERPFKTIRNFIRGEKPAKQQEQLRQRWKTASLLLSKVIGAPTLDSHSYADIPGDLEKRLAAADWPTRIQARKWLMKLTAQEKRNPPRTSGS